MEASVPGASERMVIAAKKCHLRACELGGARRNNEDAQVAAAIEGEETKCAGRTVAAFRVLVAEATDDMRKDAAREETFNLLSIREKTKGFTRYTREDMLRTIAVRKHRRDEAFDVDGYVRVNKNQKASVIREWITREFFPVGWKANVAPKNMDSASQQRAVEKAMQMNTPEMIRDGTAWAWQACQEQHAAVAAAE